MFETNTMEAIKEEAKYVIQTGCTVRQGAKEFKMSKSTFHSDVAKKLKYIDIGLYKQVRKVLDKNKAECHLRGGLAVARRAAARKAKEI